MDVRAFPDEYLAELWKGKDWKMIENLLADEQEALSIAAGKRADKTVKKLQCKLVRNLEYKCLAVRHVVNGAEAPGIDGVMWRRPEDMMRAALSLDSKGYKVTPLKLYSFQSKNTGKMRYAGIPTLHDRAMMVLYGYSLIPVLEAHAERKSFGFRPARSAMDAHEYIMDALKGEHDPRYVAVIDLKTYYATIQHAWLLKHAPMDKGVLEQFLGAGIITAGELFSSNGYSLSEGQNIAPYLANFVLDGLQRYIYDGLYGSR
ncbi:MAG: reverse transcriptase N-terminal domain-containing protein [Lachnospiraceae bacterium]|nr:reverse transcriptase N-terminal domain-containing protein [Lachnospiraceae bacterium]